MRIKCMLCIEWHKPNESVGVIVLSKKRFPLCSHSGNSGHLTIGTKLCDIFVTHAVCSVVMCLGRCDSLEERKN